MAEIDYLDAVEEPKSCEYLFIVRTAKLCSVPQLQPPPSPKPKPIDCSPVLNEEEFKKFEKYQIGELKKVLQEGNNFCQKKIQVAHTRLAIGIITAMMARNTCVKTGQQFLDEPNRHIFPANIQFH